ncbi:unnamed protein product [Prorocentrum cordatum]|uniref:Uncharacterized protein n=2 Tax=Prorocentrum cordatum TaxID=2364126 RepID=A0ABN9TXJ6_9DINO|nr:unnamed protein product [Polarella glacialis]
MDGRDFIAYRTFFWKGRLHLFDKDQRPEKNCERSQQQIHTVKFYIERAIELLEYLCNTGGQPTQQRSIFQSNLDNLQELRENLIGLGKVNDHLRAYSLAEIGHRFHERKELGNHGREVKLTKHQRQWITRQALIDLLSVYDHSTPDEQNQVEHFVLNSVVARQASEVKPACVKAWGAGRTGFGSEGSYYDYYRRHVEDDAKSAARLEAPATPPAGAAQPPELAAAAVEATAAPLRDAPGPAAAPVEARPGGFYKRVAFGRGDLPARAEGGPPARGARSVGSGLRVQFLLGHPASPVRPAHQRPLSPAERCLRRCPWVSRSCRRHGRGPSLRRPWTPPGGPRDRRHPRGALPHPPRTRPSCRKQHGPSRRRPQRRRRRARRPPCRGPWALGARRTRARRRHRPGWQRAQRWGSGGAGASGAAAHSSSTRRAAASAHSGGSPSAAVAPQALAVRGLGAGPCAAPPRHPRRQRLRLPGACRARPQHRRRRRWRLRLRHPRAHQGRWRGLLRPGPCSPWTCQSRPRQCRGRPLPRRLPRGTPLGWPRRSWRHQGRAPALRARLWRRRRPSWPRARQPRWLPAGRRASAGAAALAFCSCLPG